MNKEDKSGGQGVWDVPVWTLLYVSRLWKKREKMVNASLPRVSHPLAMASSSHQQQWLR